MKKLIFTLLAAFTVMGCSTDDSSPEDGYMKVLYLSSGTGGGVPSYQVYYGTKVNVDQVATIVTQEVYNYYLQETEQGYPKKPRWRGMVTQD